MLRMMLVSVIALLVATPIFAQSPVIHHQLEIILDPASHRIEVIDKINLHTSEKHETVFLLHEGLELIDAPTSVSLLNDELQKQYRSRFSAPVNVYAIKENTERLTLRYAGVINHPSDNTAGVIGPQGIFLSTPSAWYPVVLNAPVTFSMTVELPAAWKSISQGQRVRDDSHKQGWSELNSQEEIYLIAGQFNEYSKKHNNVEAMAFLRQPDEQLANRYLDITAQYLDMYQQMIGPYPYDKFALVENFWETGYGMPSFTLLGSTVIRLPFIPYTSYPHEIVHNWWGNGVYVDYQQGNWAEGLTSYLADHLLKEMRGGGAAFRRNILQRYADFVSEGKDFPLAQFSSRHSSSSQAVGYGKAQMTFHMLRRMVGDQHFIQGLQQFYQRYKFMPAGFAELEAVFEAVSGDDLTPFFGQWTQRTGAPEIQITNVKRIPAEQGWTLRGELRQLQKEESYRLSVPLAVTLEGDDKAHQHVVKMNNKYQPFEITLLAKPVRVDVDPEFDLFRRVSRTEIPAALSQLFGAQQALVVLPSKASSSFKQAYEKLAVSWSQTQPFLLEMKYDDEIDALPNDRAVWLLGAENRFSSDMIDILEKQGVAFQSLFEPNSQSVVVTARRNSEDDHAMGWLTADRVAAIPGLARKLPHYGKYSYLTFSGDEPANTLKGQWSVLASPMTLMLDDMVKRASLARRLSLDKSLMSE